jgi:hypothetical protein
LIVPPSQVQINHSKRKPRSNKKTNISVNNFDVTSKGYLNDTGLSFCLIDAKEELVNNEKLRNITANQLHSILNK